jgi:hypothetical protein
MKIFHSKTLIERHLRLRVGSGYREKVCPKNSSGDGNNSNLGKRRQT